MNKENTVKHTHTVEYYFSLNKEGNLAIVTKWMNLEDIMLNEISQAWKDKCPLICGIWIFIPMKIQNVEPWYITRRINVSSLIFLT